MSLEIGDVSFVHDLEVLESLNEDPDFFDDCLLEVGLTIFSFFDLRLGLALLLRLSGLETDHVLQVVDQLSGVVLDDSDSAPLVSLG